MNKRDLFVAAMNNDCCRITNWVISAFSLVNEKNETNVTPYLYKLFQTAVACYYWDSEKLVKITDAVPGQPIFSFTEKISLKAGELKNVFEDIETTYGNVLINCITLIYPFGSKIPFIKGRINANKLEEKILPLFTDVPADGVRDDKHIYPDEYLKFADAMSNMAAYSQLCVPAITEKTMTPPPGIIQLRDMLLEQNKDKLHDPAVIARIDAILVGKLKDWMKDDRGMGFLISDKSFSNVRRKLYLMGGAEAGMGDGTQVALIRKSLSEGWDLNDFSIINTASRAGSFSRGAQTELGGEATKWLFRASSNINVTVDDCGSTMGIERNSSPANRNRLLGFTLTPDSGGVKLTEENIDQYLGKNIKVRSPMYCRLGKTDYCKTCVGDKLANSPTGQSTAIAEYGSTFLTTFMKAMHNSTMSLAKMKVESSFF